MLPIPLASILLSFSLSLFASMPLGSGEGEDFSWPQWDGPARNGASRESAWSSAVRAG